jgi:glycerophosphoryl diester phosphodiesterase
VAARKTDVSMKTKRFFCFGHRGAAGHEPENTLRSVRKALELGADGIEVDAHFVDDHLIVIHDDTLDRTTNGKGAVAGKSFAHIRSLDAGLGERIPTLSEVFDAVSHRAIVNVELKGAGTASPVVNLIDEYVRQRSWRYEDFLVSSFDHDRIREAKALRPEIRVSALIDKVPRRLTEFAERLGASSVNLSRRCVTQALVEDAHRRGLKVFVYTINDPREILRMDALGVDGVFSDFPERVVSRLQARAG